MKVWHTAVTWEKSPKVQGLKLRGYRDKWSWFGAFLCVCLCVFALSYSNFKVFPLQYIWSQSSQSFPKTCNLEALIASLVKLILCLILTDGWPDFFKCLALFLQGILSLFFKLFTIYVFILDHVSQFELNTLCLLHTSINVCTCRWLTWLTRMCQRRIRSKLC